MTLKGELKTPSVGAHEKVWLPGETPWACCITTHPDGTWEGRIDNTLFAEMPEADRQKVWPGDHPLPRLHGFKRGQVVRFKKVEYPHCDLWEPAEPSAGHA